MEHRVKAEEYNGLAAAPWYVVWIDGSSMFAPRSNHPYLYTLCVEYTIYWNIVVVANLHNLLKNHSCSKLSYWALSCFLSLLLTLGLGSSVIGRDLSSCNSWSNADGNSTLMSWHVHLTNNINILTIIVLHFELSKRLRESSYCFHCVICCSVILATFDLHMLHCTFCVVGVNWILH